MSAFNATPGVDADDAISLYYATAFRTLLGNGHGGGFAHLRQELLGKPSGLVDPTDELLRNLRRRANIYRQNSNR